MKKSDRRTGREQSQTQQLRLPLRELVREALLDTVVISGLEYVSEVLEEERTELCGVLYRHDPERKFPSLHRWKIPSHYLPRVGGPDHPSGLGDPQRRRSGTDCRGS